MTSDQQQVLLGTILGNSKLIYHKEGCRLLMKSNNKDWLSLKASELNNLKGDYSKSHGNYYWKSEPSVELNNLYDQCYLNNSKLILMPILDVLRDIALAIWYCDTGALVGRTKTNACLRIQSLHGAEDIICQFFNEVGMKCKINWVRKKPTIVFDKHGTITFLKIIGPYIPKFKYNLLF